MSLGSLEQDRVWALPSSEGEKGFLRETQAVVVNRLLSEGTSGKSGVRKAPVLCKLIKCRCCQRADLIQRDFTGD